MVFYFFVLKIFAVGFPQLENPALSEFVGILLDDGSIASYECDNRGSGTRTQRVVKVTISGDEKLYSEHISSLFNKLFDKEPAKYSKKDENVLDIRCFQKDLFRFLTEEVGLKQAPKKGRAEIPERYTSGELSNHVIRGLFDTDGSLVLTDNNGVLYPRLELKISRCPMQQQVKEILDREGFRFGAYDCGGGKIRIQMNGDGQLEKWQEKIGFNNQRHIRKAERL